MPPKVERPYYRARLCNRIQVPVRTSSFTKSRFFSIDIPVKCQFRHHNLSYVIWTCDVRDTDQTQEEKMETLHLGVTGLLFSLPDVILHQVLALRKDGHHET